MNCYNHYDRDAKQRCSHCGQYICEECTVTVDHRPMCKSCIAKAATESGSTSNMGHRRYGEGIHGSPPPMRRNINAFFLFCLSAVPGLNYMYMGLMKRGMFFMSVFFMLFFVMVSFDAPLFLFLIFMVGCYSFFEGFRIRRSILNGYYVKDDIDDLTSFFNRNKRTIIILSMLVVGLTVFQLIFKYFRSALMLIAGNQYWHIYGLFSNIFGIIIVVVGIYIIYKAFCSNKPDSNDKFNGVNK